MTVLTCAIAVVATAGCATSNYNQSRIESELVRAGATPAQARCVTTKLTNTYDENQLGSHSAPSAKELAKTREILAACEVNLPLQPR